MTRERYTRVKEKKSKQREVALSTTRRLYVRACARSASTPRAVRQAARPFGASILAVRPVQPTDLVLSVISSVSHWPLRSDTHFLPGLGWRTQPNFGGANDFITHLVALSNESTYIHTFIVGLWRSRLGVVAGALGCAIKCTFDRLETPTTR